MTARRASFRALLLGAAMVLPCAAQAQLGQLPPNYAGRLGAVTQQVCATPVVTAGAYSAGNVVGGLITLPNVMLQANAAQLQSVRLTFKTTQSAEFDVSFFTAKPSTTFTDHAAPSIAAADVTLVQPIIKLTNNSSGLGTDTVYGADNIGRGIYQSQPNVYAIVTTTGTPTFGSTSDVQLCASWRLD
jgi:hypothetical protein